MVIWDIILLHADNSGKGSGMKRKHGQGSLKSKNKQTSAMLELQKKNTMPPSPPLQTERERRGEKKDMQISPSKS